MFLWIVGILPQCILLNKQNLDNTQGFTESTQAQLDELLGCVGWGLVFEGGKQVGGVGPLCSLLT